MKLPFSPPKDTWIYDDPKCLAFARPLVGALTSGLETFEMKAKESRDSFVQRIISVLLSTPSASLSAKGDSRGGAIYCHQAAENNWYFVTFIHMDDLSYNPNTSTWAISIYPSKMEISHHLKSLVTLSLFEPRLKGVDDTGNSIF